MGPRRAARLAAERLQSPEELLGLTEAPEPDQGEGVVCERAPRLGKNCRALADGGA